MAFESKRNLQPPNVVPLKKLEGVGYELRQIQQNVERATRNARGSPQAKGRRVTFTADAAGDVTVAHGLGRKPRGFNVESHTADETVFEVSKDSRNLVLTASGAATWTIWVY